MWCDVCNDALSFRFINDESVIGLTSVLTVGCHWCKKIHIIKTCHQTSAGHYVVNGKAAMGRYF